MATILETLAVKLVGDAADYEQTMKKAEGTLDSTAQKMKSIGGSLTKNVTLPLVGLGAAAIAVGTQFNAGMANVASLGVASDRVQELKTTVQDMAISVGKNTDDLAEGLYQVISAFGDTADTVAVLEINAKSAAAGLATTIDAINLTSAVTKGYGDTSAEAVQKAADLAFQTVKLGQTTFPELAASIGKVVPLAVTLGVTQEELFAQMSTLTGVTGNAAEVSTQLRATYQAILKPTTEMGNAIQNVASQLDQQGKIAGGPLVDAWREATVRYQNITKRNQDLRDKIAATSTATQEGKDAVKGMSASLKKFEKQAEDAYGTMVSASAALGPTIVESVGLTSALDMLSDTAGGNTNELGKMFGSVESLNAVLALSGPQAEVFNEKLEAMGKVSGEVDKAFDAQTKGINATGFTMAQAAVKGQVLLQKLGDGLAPALSKVLDLATPWIDKLIQMADWFANADSGTQTWIVSIVALVAAAGPVIGIIGTVISVVTSVIGVISAASGVVGVLGAALAILTGPIGIIVAAVGLLALAWTNDFLGIKTATLGAIDNIKAAWPGWIDGMKTGWSNFTSSVSSGASTLWQNVTGFFQTGGQAVVAVAQGQLGIVQGVWQAHVQATQGIVQAGMQFLRGDWEGGLNTLRDTASNVWNTIRDTFQGQLDMVRDLFNIFGWGDIGNSIVQGIANGISAGVSWITDAAQRAAQAALNAAKSWLGIGSPSKKMALQVGEPMAQGVGLGFEDEVARVTRNIGQTLNSMVGGLQPSYAGAGAGASVTIQQNFYGPADRETVKGAAQDGVNAALRARGQR